MLTLEPHGVGVQRGEFTQCRLSVIGLTAAIAIGMQFADAPPVRVAQLVQAAAGIEFEFLVQRREIVVHAFPWCSPCRPMSMVFPVPCVAVAPGRRRFTEQANGWHQQG